MVLKWVAIGLFLPMLGYADVESAWRECIDSHQSNMEWAKCGYDEIKRQDVIVSNEYSRTKVALERWEASRRWEQCDGCSVKALEEEQKNWSVWKDSACEFYKRADFGRETDVLSYPHCKFKLIEQRGQQLKLFADDVEYKLSR